MNFVVIDVGLKAFGFLFVAMNTGLPAGPASVIAPLQPVFTIPLAIGLGERPSQRQVVGVTLAIAGIAAIAAGRAHGVPLQARRHLVGRRVGPRTDRSRPAGLGDRVPDPLRQPQDAPLQAALEGI